MLDLCTMEMGGDGMACLGCAPTYLFGMKGNSKWVFHQTGLFKQEFH